MQGQVTKRRTAEDTGHLGAEDDAGTQKKILELGGAHDP